MGGPAAGAPLLALGPGVARDTGELVNNLYPRPTGRPIQSYIQLVGVRNQTALVLHFQVVQIGPLLGERHPYLVEVVQQGRGNIGATGTIAP